MSEDLKQQIMIEMSKKREALEKARGRRTISLEEMTRKSPTTTQVQIDVFEEIGEVTKSASCHQLKLESVQLLETEFTNALGANEARTVHLQPVTPEIPVRYSPNLRASIRKTQSQTQYVCVPEEDPAPPMLGTIVPKRISQCKLIRYKSEESAALEKPSLKKSDSKSMLYVYDMSQLSPNSALAMSNTIGSQTASIKRQQEIRAEQTEFEDALGRRPMTRALRHARARRSLPRSTTNPIMPILPLVVADSSRHHPPSNPISRSRCIFGLSRKQST